jgi:sialate O-acetylesterase
MSWYPLKHAICLTILAVFAVTAQAHWDLERQIDLRGPWLIEIGDNPDYARPDFDDASWQDFPGYDGYAWYRKRFGCPDNMNTDHLYLQLGKIDDVDEVFVNGARIGGKGSFPPDYKPAWDERRVYKLAADALRPGQKNVIAVRVYDGGGAGGIKKENIGIYTRLDVIDLEFDLSGTWKFAPDTSLDCVTPEFDDSGWQEIAVPGIWEKAGYPALDGIACYRKRIHLPLSAVSEKLILLLGKINDYDQVYLNGQLIGSTGEFPYPGKTDNPSHKNDERTYAIPSHLIHPDSDNLLAVRVFDLGKHGGIYQGYIGIATREAFLKYETRRKK